jgi:hypothetical protein
VYRLSFPGDGNREGGDFLTALFLRDEPVPGFRTRLELEGDVCRIFCQGVLDGPPERTASLQPDLLRLHEALGEHRVKRVRLDVSPVEYMNSGGIKSFMAWFLRAERAPLPTYVIEVIYDPSRTWQQVSFAAMGRLVPRVLRTVPVLAAAS